MKPALPDPPPVPPITNRTAVIGIVLSAIGLVGWTLVVGLLIAHPYEAKTGNGQQDLFIGLNNIFVFFVRAAIGLVGISINGTLSLTGTMVSLIGLDDEQPRPAYLGIGLGVLGILIGAALIVWRMIALGFMG